MSFLSSFFGTKKGEQADLEKTFAQFDQTQGEFLKLLDRKQCQEQFRFPKRP